MAEGSSASGVLGRIPLLDNNNYLLWKVRVRNYLEAKDLWKPVIEADMPEQPPEGTSSTDTKTQVWTKWRRNNFEVLSILTSTISDNKLRAYINADNAKQMWLAIERSMTAQSRLQRLHIGKELSSIKMLRGEAMVDYLDRAQDIAARSAAVGENISEEKLIFFVLEGLPSEYLNVVRTLQINADMTFDQIRERLIHEVLRGKSENIDMALHSDSIPGRKGQTMRDKQQEAGRFAQKKCYSCGKLGHIARQCRKKYPNNKLNNNLPVNKEKKGQSAPVYQQKNERNEFTLTLTEQKGPEKLFLTSESEPANPNEWIVDSGATAHISKYDTSFTELRSSEQNLLTAKVGEITPVKAEGKIVLRTHLNDTEYMSMKMDRVLHVPDARSNLMSVHRIVKHGHSVVFDERGVKIINRNNRTLAKGRIKDGMFVISATAESDRETALSANGTSDKECTKMLWHRRMAHTNEQYLDTLQTKEMVNGLSYQRDKLPSCDACVRGKSVKKPHYPVKDRWSNRPLELLHVDLCGPMQVSSLGGSRYLMTVVDDYTRRSFVSFLKTKAEAVPRLIELITLQENLSGHRLKAIRSDNGTELVNAEMREYTQAKGIQHQLTTTYTPQSNGTAERMNRTLIDIARTVLIEAKLPVQYWAEAVSFASYVRNVLPSRGQETTPMEMWTGRKPNVKHFRVFGCMAYAVLPKQLRGKFDEKAERMIFVGYSSNRRAYRVYDPRKQSIHEVRNVYFDETKRGSELFSGDEATEGEIDLLRYVETQPTEWFPTYEEGPRLDFPQEEQKEEKLKSSDEEYSKKESSQKEKQRQTNPRGRPKHSRGVGKEKHKQVEEPTKEQEPQGGTGLRRSARLQQKSQKKQQEEANAVAVLEQKTPRSYNEAVLSPDAKLWKAAMDEEISSLAAHDVWTLTPRPKDTKRPMRSKWVYKIKTNVDGSVNRYKARLVAVGTNQRAGVDYEQSFSPVVRMESLRVLLSLAAKLNLRTKHIDVKNAYLNGDLDDCAYMEQPEGYTKDDSLVCKLQKSLYGLPQAGNCWNKKLDETLKGIGFTQCPSDPCIYVYKNDSDFILLAVYVDDIALFSTSDTLMNQIVQCLREHFEIADLGSLKYFLGIEITQTAESISMGQQKYVREMLQDFQMENCKPVSTPSLAGENLDDCTNSPDADQRKFQEGIGKLMWLMLGSRPDLCYSVTNLARFCAHPKKVHHQAMLRIMRYVKATENYMLKFPRTKETAALNACVDASWNSTADAKSFSGYIIKLGVDVIHWKTRKQQIVALSTCEAELMAAHEVVRELVWFRSLLFDLGTEGMNSCPTIVEMDSQAAISFFKKDGQLGRTKHVNRKFFFTREEIEKGNIELVYTRGSQLLADLLTKPLPRKQTENYVTEMGLEPKTFSNEEGE